MKYNIIFLSTFFSFSVVSNDNFVSIVDGKEISYISDSFTDIITYSEWVTNKEDCINDYENEDFYFGENFNQIKTCTVEDTRIKTTTRSYENSGYSEEINKETEYNNYNETHPSITSTGSHLENNCKDIKSFNNTVNDGLYTIINNELQRSVYCDMNTDGGGWTRTDELRNEFVMNPGDLNIDNLNINHTQSLLKNIDTFISYSVPLDDHFVDYKGFPVQMVKLNINGSWIMINSLDYNILDYNSFCWYKENVLNTCGNEIIINSNQIKGISDTESHAGTSNTDNLIKYNLDFFVR